MDIDFLKGLWILVFFFFTLILLFAWSKIAIIMRKIKTINELLEKTAGLQGDTTGAAKESTGASSGA